MTNDGATILSIHYLPCITWFRNFLQNENIILDQHEHFIKQTYRNRCIILSANGPLALTIPVKKIKHHIPMHEMEIENDFNWQKQHWEAIRSAYNTSPFFEHYTHHFEKFYQNEFNHLSEFNLELIKVCLNILKVEMEIRLTDTYVHSPAEGTDWRQAIHPKKKSGENFKPYLQVFASKFSFVPNLSVVDLLFNQGTKAGEYFL
ncbi:MAG: WbqC family protein [Bacteroidia bacterium]